MPCSGGSNAGSVLLGPLTPVAATDYAGWAQSRVAYRGTARSRSALSVRDFVRA